MVLLSTAAAAARPLVCAKSTLRPLSTLVGLRPSSSLLASSPTLRHAKPFRHAVAGGRAPTALSLLIARGQHVEATTARSGTVVIPEGAGADLPLPTGGKGQLPDLTSSEYTYPRLVGGRQVGHILPQTEVGANHPFHLVDLSPWPKAMAGALLPLMGGTVLAMSNTVGGGMLMLASVIQVTYIMQRWLNDVVAEGAYMGNHTMRVVNNLVTGFSLFILSEVMLFFSIFWAFLHSSLSPSVELGSMWPPLGIEPLEAGLIPTLNTVLLVSSGASVTWAHHALLAGQRASALNGMAITLAFSCVFTGLQAYEYHISPFTWADSVFGNTFYFSTGAHGLHVILGTTMLAIGTARIANYQLTQHHHLGLEAGILYWHMVDVVWLLLYGMVYWWGS